MVTALKVQHPTEEPTESPTNLPSDSPSKTPTKSPSHSPTISPYVYCQQSLECKCKATAQCIFDFEGSARCADTKLSTAYNGQDIIINCIGTSSCFALSGDLSSANSVTWNCEGVNSCNTASLDKCGFECELNCIDEQSCGDNYLERVNDNSAFTCNGIGCITPEPTPAPTSQPSDSPIADGDPTRAPSVGTPSPSKSPTNDPTISPSSIPTESPDINGVTVTNQPDIDFTSTSSPLEITTASKSTPGATEDGDGPSSSFTTGDIGEGGNRVTSLPESMLSNTAILGAILGILALVCCVGCLIIFLCCRYSQSKKNKEKEMQKNEAVELNDASGSPKINSISTEITREDVLEDVVIKVKSGVSSQNHEGVGYVNAFMPRARMEVEHRQAPSIQLTQQNMDMYNPPMIAMQDVNNIYPYFKSYSDILNDEELVGNDDEKMHIAEVDGLRNNGTKGLTNNGVGDDDYQPPFMMDNIIMEDPIDEFNHFQNDMYEYGISDEPDDDLLQGVTTADIDYAVDDE